MNLVVPLMDLLFPPKCVFCRGKTEDEPVTPGVCRSCYRALPEPEGCCKRCAQPKRDASADCLECAGRVFSFTSACAVDEYKGAIKSTIHKYKYKNRKELAGPLGSLLAVQIRRRGWTAADAVVPIPLHHEKLLERGYDQALLLAQVLGDELRLPVKRLLIREKATPSQTKLSAKERWVNVADAFASVQDQQMPQRIILVDDLLTTGATAHFAGQQLLRAGVREIYLAVVGR
jgi:competence protein ComFC